MVCIYSEIKTKTEHEIGRIESIKHIEWLLIGFFLYFAILRQKIEFFEFFTFVIGAQIPDILEGILFKRNIKAEKRRLITHTVLFPVLILILSVNINSYIFYFSLAYLGHLTLDLFAGGDPVFLFGPFTNKFNLLFVKKEKRLEIGDFVYKKVGYLWADSTNGDLAWFWILQFFGSILGAISFCIYLIRVS